MYCVALYITFNKFFITSLYNCWKCMGEKGRIKLWKTMLSKFEVPILHYLERQGFGFKSTLTPAWSHPYLPGCSPKPENKEKEIKIKFFAGNSLPPYRVTCAQCTFLSSLGAISCSETLAYLKHSNVQIKAFKYSSCHLWSKHTAFITDSSQADTSHEIFNLPMTERMVSLGSRIFTSYHPDWRDYPQFLT
jgi:hypothetical protein